MNRFSQKIQSMPWLNRFLSDVRGVSAVEFALIVPILVALYLGAAELSQALTAQRKLTQVATMVGDLVTQDDNISDAEMDDIIDAAGSVLSPFGEADLTLRVTSIRLDDPDDGHYVHWSEGSYIDAHPLDAELDIPEGLLTVGSSIILVEATYDHTSLFNSVIDGSVEIADTAYLRPRRSAWVTRD